MSDVCLKTRTLPLVSRKDKLMTLPGEKPVERKKLIEGARRCRL